MKLWLQITAWCSVSLPTLLLCGVLCKLGVLVMEQLHFQLYTWVSASKPLCAPVSHLMGTDHSCSPVQEDAGRCPSGGYLHFWKLCSFSDEESSHFASLFIRWMGTDGRQLSFLIACTKQKIINACMRAGVKHFHVLRENVDHNLIPALPWEQLWAATHSGSQQLYN